MSKIRRISDNFLVKYEIKEYCFLGGTSTYNRTYAVSNSYEALFLFLKEKLADGESLDSAKTYYYKINGSPQITVYFVGEDEDSKEAKKWEGTGLWEGFTICFDINQ